MVSFRGWLIVSTPVVGLWNFVRRFHSDDLSVTPVLYIQSAQFFALAAEFHYLRFKQHSRYYFQYIYFVDYLFFTENLIIFNFWKVLIIL